MDFGAGPAADCCLCPRLAAYRAQNRVALPGAHNAPVPVFGSADARLAVVGLAPGVKGANRTGRPFTGDFAGDLLYATLLEFGFARGRYQARADDGLALADCAIVNAVRCVPPQNKPTPAETAACRPFLVDDLSRMGRLRAIVALGRIAHDSVVRTLGAKPGRVAFGHCAEHPMTVAGGAAVVLIDSYHCSRYNTNTGVLTPDMFRAVFAAVRRHLDKGASP